MGKGRGFGPRSMDGKREKEGGGEGEQLASSLQGWVKGSLVTGVCHSDSIDNSLAILVGPLFEGSGQRGGIKWN